jgi:predicted MPP superfamily phosphohydrolase
MKKRLTTCFIAYFLIFTVCFTDFQTNAFFPPQDSIKGSSKPFTVLWLADPQYYASYYPATYDFLGNWFVKKYKRNSFGYVIVSGDIVNSADCTKQWEIASRNFKKLDAANVPYGVVAGNHDIIVNNSIDYSMFGNYFSASRYKDKPWYGGSMDNNRNHYDLMTFGGHDFIFLYLGYGTEATTKSVSWSNKVLKEFSQRNAILILHEYMDTDGKLTKSGLSVFNRIISQNDNLLLVLCGHYHGAQRNIKTIYKSDGSIRKVLEILSDYQNAPHGGDGYLRYLEFYPDSGILRVFSYSPYIKRYNFFGAGCDSFIENLELID